MTSPIWYQYHFRIRDDSTALNTSGGWLSGEDNAGGVPDVSVGVPFRIRFRIGETNDKGGNNHFMVYASLNSGTYIELAAAGEAVGRPVASDQYSDTAAITTQFLTSGGGTFINGSGDCADNDEISTIDNEETELEFCILLNRIWNDGTNTYELAEDDNIKFRVYVADAAFNYYNNTAEVNVGSLATGIVGGNFVETPGTVGPFCDGNGNLYYFSEIGQFNEDPVMHKSTDNGLTWAAVDDSNKPTTQDYEGVDCFHDAANKTIHIALDQGSSAIYHTFRTSDHATNPDTWGVKDEDIVSSKTYLFNHTSINVRSDGDVVATYISGDTPPHIYYKIRTGTWGSEVDIDTGLSSYNLQGCTAVIGESDKIHFFYTDHTNDDLYHKSLTSGDSLSARESVETDLHQAIECGSTVPVYYDDSGTEEITVGYVDNTNGYLYTVDVTEDGTPETRKQVDNKTIRVDGWPLGYGVPQAILVVDATNKNTYALYIENSSGNLYLNSRSGTGDWGTPEQLETGSYYQLSANVYTRSGTTYIGYFYDQDSGNNPGQVWYKTYGLVSDIYVTPSPAVAVAGNVDPTVVHGSISITPAQVAAVAAIVDPTIYAPCILTPDPAESVAGKVDPTVIKGSITIAPTEVAAIAAIVDPTVIHGSISITPTQVAAVAAIVDPTVIEGGDVEVTPTPASAVAAVVAPTYVKWGSRYGRPINGTVYYWNNLWYCIDEITRNDSDYQDSYWGMTGIWCSHDLSPMTDPGVHWGHEIGITAREWVTPYGTVLKVELIEDVTTIATRYIDTPGGTWTMYRFPLTEAEAANITDYTDLTLKITTTEVGGEDNFAGISWLWFRAPYYGEWVELTEDKATAIGAKVDPTVLLSGVEVTPTPAAAVAAVVDPTVYAPCILTPSPVAAVAAVVDPTVIHGSIIISPSEVTAIAATVDPTVIHGSITLTPAQVAAIAAVVAPTIVQSSTTATPAPASAVGATADPDVEAGDIQITPDPAESVAGIVNPTIVQSSTTASPDPAESVAGIVSPTVILGNTTASPAAAAAVAEAVIGAIIGGDVFLTPSPAAAIGSGVDPGVILGSIILSPSPAAAVSSSIDPTVIHGSITITPTPAASVGSVVAPTIVQTSTTATPDPAAAIAATYGPIVITGDIQITPDPAEALGATVDPTVIRGSITITATEAAAIAGIADPVVVQSSTTASPAAVSAVAGVAGGVALITSPLAIIMTLSAADANDLALATAIAYTLALSSADANDLALAIAEGYTLTLSLS